LSEIEVGDVIELPMDENESASVVSALSSYVWRESNKIGKKFSVKRIKLGIGIWRTK
jgi:hypothetical protein